MALINLEGFDWEASKEFLETDDMIVVIAESFIEEIDGYKTEFSEFFSDLSKPENVENYCIKAHAVKSTCKMLGNMTVSDYFKELEFAARDKDVDKIKELHPGLMERLDMLQKQLSQLL